MLLLNFNFLVTMLFTDIWSFWFFLELSFLRPSSCKEWIHQLKVLGQAVLGQVVLILKKLSTLILLLPFLLWKVRPVACLLSWLHNSHESVVFVCSVIFFRPLSFSVVSCYLPLRKVFCGTYDVSWSWIFIPLISLFALFLSIFHLKYLEDIACASKV